MMQVYPCGYSAHAALIEQLMRVNPALLLIDTRYSPTSRVPTWRRDTLVRAYGGRYRWEGRWLGNINYRSGGPIQLASPGTGIPVLERYFQGGYDLLLMCACAHYERCHRRVIVDLLRERCPEAVIVHPETLPASCVAMSSVRQEKTR